MIARIAATLLLAAAAAAAPSPSTRLSTSPSTRHYRIEADGSELRWDLPATLHTVEGRAPRLSGTIDLKRGPISRTEPNVEPWHGRVRVVVEAGAMATGNSSRDRKMREITLETPRFPEIVFESRHIEADLSRFKPGEHLTVEVAGDLTVHGRTASLRLPVDVFVEADHVMLAGGFSIGWKQFGLPDPSFGIITVREPVRVTFRLRAAPVRRGP
ncbi:MAG TPA: YceI family protein [Thermoanaerobaculia bacterium]|nr:YceI family protein [Thermoanaerobaculia bacterium]